MHRLILYFYKSETLLSLVTIHGAVSTKDSSSNNTSNTISDLDCLLGLLINTELTAFSTILEHLKLHTKWADMYDAISAVSHLPCSQSFTAMVLIRHQDS